VIPLKDQIFESWALTETNTVLGWKGRRGFTKVMVPQNKQE
jgi:uncharacterized protein (DUF427 family)